MTDELVPSVDLLEREIDRLYALPAEGFTAARNELSKALRKQGERDSADRV